MNKSYAFYFLIVLTCATKAFAAPEKKIVDGVTYFVVRASANSVRVLWKDQDGKQLRTFPSATQYLRRQGLEPDMLMNGGIFEPGGVPSGLLVQEGKEFVTVNRQDGKGNFYLKPNGIFLIGTKGARVIRTDEYPVKDERIEYAVQSGPLLLREGKVHPQFKSDSTSRLHRNGVGVAKTGEIVFAITDLASPKFPNLHEFTELFRSLGCEDALFLDGDLSQMHWGVDVAKPSNHIASIIAVTKTNVLPHTRE